jgi:hypothetical protein
MKVIKTASGKNRIKISKKEWTLIGKKARWIKSANNKVSYTAVFSLESIEQGKPTPWQSIIANIEIPDGWTTYADHMTIQMGSCPDPSLIGNEVTLEVTKIGQDDKALALGVNSTLSKNKIPHITVATAPGVKPFQSNKIENWKPINGFTLHGIVAECTQDKKILTKEESISLAADAEKAKADAERAKLEEKARKAKEREEKRLRIQEIYTSEGFEGAFNYLQGENPNLPERAIKGMLRGFGIAG